MSGSKRRSFLDAYCMSGKIYFDVMAEKQTGAEQNFLAVAKRRFGENHFSVERKLNLKRVFQNSLAASEQRMKLAFESRLQQATQCVGQLQVTIEAGVDDRRPVSLCDRQYDDGDTVVSDLAQDHRRPPLRT